MSFVLWPLLKTFSLQELLHHPWRTVAALVAVMLGVALAFSVHLINASALDEFSQALRSVGGQADLELRSRSVSASLDEAVLQTLRQNPAVATASPVLELSTYALPALPLVKPADPSKPTQRVLLRVLGVDALQVATLAPDLMPMPTGDADRMALFAPDTVFLNAAARQALGDGSVQLQQGLQLKRAAVEGSVRAPGNPLAVMDIGAAQDFFGKRGQLTRVDIRLQPGSDREAVARILEGTPGWNAEWKLSQPGDAAERIGNLSRAYRVNLTVLALIALFTGGFLVFSVLALSVTRRAQQFALLGVLGLTGSQRLHLVLLEAGLLGLLGSALGIALGTGLAALALTLLGGDLGGGYFAGAAPPLQWSTLAALVFAALGVATALVGAWWPARLAQALPPAQTLKGLGALQDHRHTAWMGPALLLAGGLLAMTPPLWGMPLGAYLSVALLLVGGIACLPWLVGQVLDRVAPLLAHRLLPLLAVERARRVRQSAAVAVSGVVASLSLAVALTVMVSSFRHSVTTWLDTVLPASLYVRSAGSGNANELAYFDPAFVQAAARVGGVQRLSAQRTLQLTLDAAKPGVALMVRSLQDAQGRTAGLPLVGDAVAVPAGRIGIYVSEAVVDLYGARVGQNFAPLQQVFAAGSTNTAGAPMFFVAGIWRDYARQFGTIAMDSADYARLSDDRRVNDLAFWLQPGTDAEAVEQALRTLADQLAGTPDGQAGQLLEFGSATQIRATTLKIFDRSFAVTYWLQAVAVGIGLFGIAASFSAQVLARRKEFGLLAHLGLTRSQILRVVAAEGAAWTSLGAIAGVALGLAVAVVLVHVVNPQSFHWSMELSLPWLRLLGLAAAVVAAGTVTAWLAGQAAAGHDAVMAVKEDW
ncbi:ABC transporter permease [Rhodoferax lacus]|uniref:ABC transporter permease n=1 Tax=Rhodoferax lacus TaxID=2184758 RepID=A0A3E1R853_9BURK|nr:ABC transporter permease [Rhodoferax lacus]RFO95423.1 ABC transporter permease [Rhodoferax lacus]